MEEIIHKIKASFRASSKAPPTELIFYRVGKILGKGAFGKVNLAMHKLARKLVALKSLSKDSLKEQD